MNVICTVFIKGAFKQDTYCSVIHTVALWCFFIVVCSVQVTPEKYCKLVSEEGGLAIIGKNYLSSFLVFWINFIKKFLLSTGTFKNLRNLVPFFWSFTDQLYFAVEFSNRIIMNIEKFRGNSERELHRGADQQRGCT